MKDSRNELKENEGGAMDRVARSGCRCDCLAAILVNMHASQGDSVDGPEFFTLLCANEEFCAELGRAVLAGGRLETAIKRLLSRHGFGKDTSKATLGRLIEFCRKEVLIAKMIPALETLRDQRNYLIHNVHALLSDLIQETILEREGLIDSDVSTYTERAWLLKENLNGLAAILERDESSEAK